MLYCGVLLFFLFVCEDNGIGISILTLDGWVVCVYADCLGLYYCYVDGGDVEAVVAVIREIVAWVCIYWRLAFFHVDTVCYFGHVGVDVELVYCSLAEIVADFVHDLVVRTVACLVQCGVLLLIEVLECYEQVCRWVDDVLAEVVGLLKFIDFDVV